MTITKEQARADLEKIMAQFGTLGPGSDLDRAAQLVMQTFGVLERRLGKKDAIKMLYVDNPQASMLLPGTVYEIARQYTDGSMNEVEARERLQETSRKYGEVFKEMGISPELSEVLFGRGGLH